MILPLTQPDEWKWISVDNRRLLGKIKSGRVELWEEFRGTYNRLEPGFIKDGTLVLFHSNGFAEYPLTLVSMIDADIKGLVISY